MGNFKDVAVIDVLVKPGDSIEPETPLVTLETEKATMDVPSTVGGVVERVVVSKGGRVNAGDVVVAVRSEEAAAAPAGAASEAQSAKPAPAAPSAPASPAPATRPAEPERPKAAPAPAPAPAPAGTTSLSAVDEPGFSAAHASPSVRRFARELGVNLAAVGGTGFKGRITQDDVKGFVKKSLAGGTPGAGTAGARGGALPSVPAVDFAQFGPIEVRPLSRIQRISGARLHA